MQNGLAPSITTFTAGNGFTVTVVPVETAEVQVPVICLTV